MGKKGTRALILEGLLGVWRNKGTGACSRRRWDQLDVDGEGRWKAGTLNWGQIRENRENMATHGNFERERGNKDLPGRFFQGFDIELSHEIMFGFVNEIDTSRKNLKIQPTEKIGPFG